MGIVKRFRKLNHNTSLSLGKVRMGGITIAFIFLLGIGEKFVPRWLNLSPETSYIIGQVTGFVICVLFASMIGLRLARLTPRNRWAMISIFGFGMLVGQIVSVLTHIGEEKSGLSEYFPYDVILSVVAGVGGYIAWRVHTTRLRRIKFEREARIKRRRHKNI